VGATGEMAGVQESMRLAARSSQGRGIRTAGWGGAAWGGAAGLSPSLCLLLLNSPLPPLLPLLLLAGIAAAGAPPSETVATAAVAGDAAALIEV